MNQRIYQDDLAKLLGVGVRTLRQWRLSDAQGTSLYLPAHRDSMTTPSWYHPEDVIEFCKRNPRYGERLLAVTAPDAVQAEFIPPVVALPQATTLDQLRGTAAELVVGLGLLSPSLT